MYFGFGHAGEAQHHKSTQFWNSCLLACKIKPGIGELSFQNFYTKHQHASGSTISADLGIEHLYVSTWVSTVPGPISCISLESIGNTERSGSACQKGKITVLCAAAMGQELADVDLKIACSWACGFVPGTWFTVLLRVLNWVATGEDLGRF